ncbi:MAG TPA: long-chain fatty acid--CoA ligase, partial [Thermoplasmata archaeon]|nr:long-chain fatty acid--CoA ligase [Thermoplasmata archaeon]
MGDSPSTAPEPASRPWLAHYPKEISPTFEVPDGSLDEAVARSVERWADRDAFVYYGAHWSYARFWEATGRFAAALHRDGLGAGDRVALYLPNAPAYPIAFFGALRLGLTVVQVSPLYLGEDLSGLLGDAQPKAIVTLDVLWPNLAKLPEGRVPAVAYVATVREFYPWFKRPFVNRVLRRRGLRPGTPKAPGVRPWANALMNSGEFPKPVRDPARDVAVLQYTGGTTGVPKAAMLTHRNLLVNALQCQRWFPIVPPGTSVVLAAIPFFHVYGMTVALNYPLLSGSTVVLENRPDPDEMLGLIARYKPQELPGVPTLYRAIADHPKVGRVDVRSIRLCVSGSAPLPAEVSERFERITGGHLVEGYGLTEASPVTHANPIDHTLRRAGSIGLPLPLTDQRIVDLETGTRVLPLGEVGELCVKGPQVMLGYYRRPEETALVLSDGWLRTGDVARIDAEGYAYIVDRKKDMIDVGGFKVYPREVEEVVFRHPQVAEAAVVGIPDPSLGEVVKAFVVARPGPRPTEAEVIAFVRERIAHY